MGKSRETKRGEWLRVEESTGESEEGGERLRGERASDRVKETRIRSALIRESGSGKRTKRELTEKRERVAVNGNRERPEYWVRVEEIGSGKRKKRVENGIGFKVQRIGQVGFEMV